MRSTAQEVCRSQNSRPERNDIKEKEINNLHFDKKLSMLGMSRKTNILLRSQGFQNARFSFFFLNSLNRPCGHYI